MRTIKLSLLVLLLSSPAAFAQVVGGTAVPIGAHPDVALVVAPAALCTGTLVAPDVVLTAGHCIDTHPTSVLIGSVDYAKPGGEQIAVARAIAYPDWQHTFDVGVLVLQHPAAPSPHAIASACTIKHLEPGAAATVVGFGLTTKTGTGDNTRMRQGSLVVADATCASDPACAPAVAPNGEFTAGGNGVDSCFGDSGGPVLLAGALVGVVSRGVGEPGAPCGGGGVYVRADRVVAWIERVTSRKLVRASCDSPADGSGDPTDDGGCAIGGASGAGAIGLALAFIALGLASVGARKRDTTRRQCPRSR